MQSKYKSLGAKTLLMLVLLLALITGALGDGAVRAIAWIGSALFAAMLARPARLSRWLPCVIVILCAALLASAHADVTLWIWMLPLCLLGISGRLGRTLNIAAYLSCVVYMGWMLTPPTAIVAALSLAVVWLLCLERQRLSVATPASTSSDWLLPPASLDADTRQELKRTEREVLHGEVVVFGCAHSTAADMEQLCQRLREQLALYERAYRLNDFGIAVILVTTTAEAADQRRQQLKYAIAPHREVSVTPLADIGDRFTRHHRQPTTRATEMQPWH